MSCDLKNLPWDIFQTHVSFRVLRMASTSRHCTAKVMQKTMIRTHAPLSSYMIWCTILTCAQKLTCSQLSLPHGNQTKKNNEETKNIKRICSEETVQSWSPWSQSWGWGEIFVEEVGLEPGVKERWSYGWWEWWVDRVRRSGRSMNRKDRTLYFL